jgi:uncharacterized membrane protein
MNAIYAGYFLIAFVSFVLMITLNFEALKKFSTAKLILLYIALPILHFRTFMEWIMKFIKIYKNKIDTL